MFGKEQSNDADALRKEKEIDLKKRKKKEKETRESYHFGAKIAVCWSFLDVSLYESLTTPCFHKLSAPPP